jgi:hypothetical protein
MTNELDKADVAFLINALWTSLLAPPWAKNDLIEVGKLVYAKVELKDVDGPLFDRLLPSLSKAAAVLGQKILQLTSDKTRQPAATAAPETPPEKTHVD